MTIFYAVRNTFLGCLLLGLAACNKTTEEFQTEKLEEYYPLQTGKYITYRLDSTVFTGFGRITEVHKYQEKHVVDALVTDNLGRPSYRVFRYLSDSAGTAAWRPGGSFLVTIANNQVEVIENNLRFVKLRLPFRDGNTWKGNAFLPLEPYSTLYNFNNDDNMDEWEYYYDGDKQAVKIGTQTVEDVYTVQAADVSYNFPMKTDTSYASRTFAREQYAKNIGLVAKEFYLWESQPNAIISSTPPYSTTWDPYKTGFEVKMWMIDHN